MSGRSPLWLKIGLIVGTIGLTILMLDTLLDFVGVFGGWGLDR